MDLAKLKAEYKGILDKAKTENRSISKDEEARIEILKAEIAKAEKAIADQADAQAAQLRSIAAAQSIDAAVKKTANDVYRSIAKGNNEVNDQIVISDIVRQFQQISPIFAAHENIQTWATGTPYTFIKVTKGANDNGAKKAEGDAGTADAGSAMAPVQVAFSVYSGDIITITQEMLEDAKFDVAKEVITLGMAKGVLLWDNDAADALLEYDEEPTETADTAWAISDLIKAYFEIPQRNRYGIKFVCSPVGAAALVDLMDFEDTAKLAAIGLTMENLVVSDNMPDDQILLCNITLALAAARKEPVRVVKLDVSAGQTVEVQPRMAVALRDATAVAGRKLKAAPPPG
jgi:HK97 family phage major capsid protein